MRRLLTMKENAGHVPRTLRISAGLYRLKQGLFIETKFDDLFVESTSSDSKRFGGGIHTAFVRLYGFANELAFESSNRFAQRIRHIVKVLIALDSLRHRPSSASGRQNAPFADMAQFTHIAGPVMCKQSGEIVLIELWRIDLVNLSVFVQKMRCQKNQIIPSLPQRRQSQYDRVQSKQKVLTQAAFLGCLYDIFVSR